MLLVVSASSIVKLNNWYMLWYSRSRLGVILPWSRSTRMYGREKIAVVSPTNAVSVTRNTFSGSMKNSWFHANSGPSEITRSVRPQAATKVPRLKPTLISGASSRCPVSASTTPPSKRDRPIRGRRLPFSLRRAASRGAVENASEREGLIYWSFSFSRWRISRLSNCSRIWNMNTPRISTPISTSSAMPSSTTIGMP